MEELVLERSEGMEGAQSSILPFLQAQQKAADELGQSSVKVEAIFSNLLMWSDTNGKNE